MVPAQCRTEIRMRIAVRGTALIRFTAMVATRATTVAEPMPRAAGTGGLAVMLAILRLGATTAMAHGLEVSGTAASHNRPPIENSERNGCPYQGGPVMAADKSSWSHP
jgi:hypothetical protein